MYMKACFSTHLPCSLETPKGSRLIEKNSRAGTSHSVCRNAGSKLSSCENLNYKYQFYCMF